MDYFIVYALIGILLFVANPNEYLTRCGVDLSIPSHRRRAIIIGVFLYALLWFPAVIAAILLKVFK